MRAAERRAQANERAATAGRAVVAAAKVKAGRADDLLLTYRGADRLEQGFASEFQELVGLAQEIDPDTGRQ